MHVITFPNDPLTNAARLIAKKLLSSGHRAYFAGGFVRDSLLGRPVHDIDIATDADPEEIERLFPGRSLPIGKAFGIITVNQNGIPFDVATFRAEGEYVDGRHPTSISKTTPEKDALRRDFTINGLFTDPESGEILDFVGGLADLEKGIIRAIGDPQKRFAEDHLRMIRAIRFTSVLQGTLDPETKRAITHAAENIRTVSTERIASEFTRVLCESPKPSIGLNLLRETGLLAHLFPAVNALYGCEQPPQFHPEGDVWTHTCLMLDAAQPKPLPAALAWGILLHDIGKPPTFQIRFNKHDKAPRITFQCHADIGADMAKDLLEKLKMPNALIDTVRFLIENHMRMVDAAKMRIAKRRRLMANPAFPSLLELLRLDSLFSCGDLSDWNFLNDQFQKIQLEPALPESLINGKDLIALGLSPGPSFSRILRAVFDAQLDGTIFTKEEAIALAKSLF